MVWKIVDLIQFSMISKIESMRVRWIEGPDDLLSGESSENSVQKKCQTNKNIPGLVCFAWIAFRQLTCGIQRSMPSKIILQASKMLLKNNGFAKMLLKFGIDSDRGWV